MASINGSTCESTDRPRSRRSECASARVNEPTRSRRSSARCAQPPRATPRSAARVRMYVPLPHSTMTVASGYGPGSNDSISNRSIRAGRGWRLHFLALARELVQATSAHLHRGDHRRQLLDVSHELRERTLHIGLGERHRMLIQDLAGRRRACWWRCRTRSAPGTPCRLRRDSAAGAWRGPRPTRSTPVASGSSVPA